MSEIKINVSHLIDKKILELSNKEPLLITCYTNMKIGKRNTAKDFFYGVVYYSKNDKKSYIDWVNLESLTFFPLNTILYEGNVTKKEALIQQISLNSEKCNYKTFGKLPLFDKIFSKNSKFIRFFKNEYYAEYKTLKITFVIPSIVIGSKFYFPTTRLRESMLLQNLDGLYYKDKSSYIKKELFLKKKTSSKYRDNIILTYLYAFSDYAREKFLSILSQIKRKEEYYQKNKNILEYCPIRYEFPFDNNVDIIVRGEFFDDCFFVYEIIKYSESQLLKTDEFKILYEGRSPVTFSPNRNVIPLNKPNKIDKDNLSKSGAYQPNTEKVDLFLDSSKENIDKVKIKKTIEKKLVASNNEIINQEIDKEMSITLGYDKNSDAENVKGQLGIISESFKAYLEELKKQVDNLKIIPKKGYVYASFQYREFYCMLIELNLRNAATYIITSKKTIPGSVANRFNYYRIVEHLSIKEIGEKLFLKNMCLLPPQKHVSSRKKWVDRVLSKIIEQKCKRNIV